MSDTKAFDSSWESLQQYQCPEWFRDAKFGVWAHWGPQVVPMIGDWYARNMYVEDHPMYLHHCKTYGHPSEFGYKDIVKLWKAENFDPDKLMAFYKQIGARYFYCCSSHCDNFDLWDSKHHQWNAVNYGPEKDIVGLFEAAARKAGLKFGITEHFERAYSWFNTNKGADTKGPYAGVPYDGNDPAYEDLYIEPHDDTASCFPANPSEKWMKHWQARMIDLIDKYNPDLLYNDGAVPFDEIGREVFAHFYNRNMERNGELNGVYAVKDDKHLASHGYHGEYREGIGVLDVERGVIDGLSAEPWQTDTCVGDWYYKLDAMYKPPEEIITMLVDIVSKNGNLLLNFPLRPDGTLDEYEEWLALEMGQWMEINASAIYETRPYKIYGEGPTQLKAGLFAERDKKEFTSEDFRFTQSKSGDVLNAFLMAWPENNEVVITELAEGKGPETIESLSLLGGNALGEWKRDAAGLHIMLPQERPCDYVYGIQISVSN